MKKFIVSIMIVATFLFANSASAQSQWASSVVEDGRAYYTPSSITTKTEALADKNLLREANSCIGQLIVNCGSAPSERCREAYGPCGNTYEKAKARPGVGASWVKRQIALAFKKLASKEDLKTLRDEVLLKLEELECRIAGLEKRMDAMEAEIVVLKKKTDANEHKNAMHDVRLNEHDALLLKMGQKARFDIGATLVLSSDIYGVAGVIGLNFAITDIVRAKVHTGIGVSFDGEAMLVGQAGPEFVFGEEKNLAIGLSAIYLKEEMNDKGDTFIGAGPEFSFYFTEHGFFSVLAGIGTSTHIENAPIPGYPLRTERSWDLAWSVLATIGATF